MQQLRRLIRRLSPGVLEAELVAAEAAFQLRPVAKGHYLLRPPQVCDELWLVQAGCFRIFLRAETGLETTAWLAFEDMLTSELHSLLTRQPSVYWVQALEDGAVFSIGRTELEGLYRQHPGLQQFGLRLTETALVSAIERLTSFQTETAQARYAHLLHRPHYLRRVALRDLASFLGLTPNSLSRLRRRWRP